MVKFLPIHNIFYLILIVIFSSGDDDAISQGFVFPALILALSLLWLVITWRRRLYEFSLVAPPKSALTYGTLTNLLFAVVISFTIRLENNGTNLDVFLAVSQISLIFVLDAMSW